MKVQPIIQKDRIYVCNKCKRIVSRVFQKGQCAECLAPSLARASKFATMMRQEIFK